MTLVPLRFITWPFGLFTVALPVPVMPEKSKRPMIRPSLLTMTEPGPSPLIARSSGEPATDRTWAPVPTFRVVVAPAPVVMSITAVELEVPRPITASPLEMLITPPPSELVRMPWPPVEITSGLMLTEMPPVPAIASTPAVEAPTT